MNIKSRGFVLTLDQEEENFVNKIIDFVDDLEHEIFESNALVPDDLQAILTDLKDNARKLRDNEFYDEGD